MAQFLFGNFWKIVLVFFIINFLILLLICLDIFDYFNDTWIDKFVRCWEDFATIANTVLILIFWSLIIWFIYYWAYS